jgi:multicomponent K+:H+ antiporter subunit G
MIVDLLVALLLLASGPLVLVAATGLWRLPDFFLRLHASALANTLASWAVALACAVHLSTDAGRLALHHWVIVILLSITAPITTMLLARAALFRERAKAASPSRAPDREKSP